MKQVLFLCTANYYRSRFAEHLFNWLAPQYGLPWKADSRGLKTDGWGNIGAISDFTVDALSLRGIPLPDEHRHPRRLTLDDLARSQLVVAIKEAEHRPLMTVQFPHWADRIEYWHVHDIDCAPPDDALPVLEQRVRDLVVQLRDSPAARSDFAVPA